LAIGKDSNFLVPVFPVQVELNRSFYSVNFHLKKAREQQSSEFPELRVSSGVLDLPYYYGIFPNG